MTKANNCRIIATTYYTGSAWTNLDTTGMVNPMTTTGDMIYSSSGSTPARLGLGTANGVPYLNASKVLTTGSALTFDGASISRHDVTDQPQTSVIQELKACQGALGEIEEVAKAARHNVKLLFTWGNHDIRFGNRLAQHAPQFKEVQGFKLTDHIITWSNENDLVYDCFMGSGTTAERSGGARSGYVGRGFPPAVRRVETADSADDPAAQHP